MNRYRAFRGAMLRLAVCGFFAAWGACGASADDAAGEVPKTVPLRIHPRAIDPFRADRPLLPEGPDLKPGNAAVVLLRMPWGQTAFMTGDYERVGALSGLPSDDPRVAELQFDHFAGQMRRAAYMRDADWNYPIDEEPFGEILLPDLQGLRRFVDYGMTVWVNQRLAKGDLDAAREGVLVKLACARQVARTPFTINRFVAELFAVNALESLERVIAHPSAPNFHRELGLLPSSIGIGVGHLQWEAVEPERTLPTLRAGMPKAGDGEAWARVLREWIDGYAIDDSIPTEDKVARLRAGASAAGREAFATAAPADLDLATAGDDEVAVRFLLAWTKTLAERAEAAWLREPPDAIAAIVELDEHRKRSEERLTPWATGATSEPLHCYLSHHLFGRRARMLEVVEALRDAAARNGGRFPATLAEVSAHVPRDPFTGEPFLYEPATDGRSARLATPPIPGVDEPRYARVYELTLAEE